MTKMNVFRKNKQFNFCYSVKKSSNILKQIFDKNGTKKIITQKGALLFFLVKYIKMNGKLSIFNNIC